MKFLTLKEAVHTQFTKMLNTGNVFSVSVNKHILKDTYLGSFPEGTNPIFRERTEHDCNCCNNFIRAAGSAVAFIEGKLVTIWDVDVGGHYQVVADAMAELVRSKSIDSIFLHLDKTVGSDKTPDNYSDVIWDHFFMVLPKKFVKPKDSIASLKSDARNNYAVFKRSIEEINVEAISAVLELITEKSIYRGEEHLTRVKDLKKFKRLYDKAECKDEFLWITSAKLGPASAFRNSVIGTLLVDLSEGKDLELAVKAYENKVAPENYRRSSALVTQSMIDNAQKVLTDLDLEDSIERRHAVVHDITINDVLFADRSVKPTMGVLSSIIKPTAHKEIKNTNSTDISIEDFMSNVVPNVDSIELLVEGKHQRNFMSLVAPTTKDCKPITKWDNNFSWSYHGEIADSSMRQNVKAEGGNTDGVLRFSIQWNTPDRPYGYDLDAHCISGSERICYNNKQGNHVSGSLDVDIQRPRGVAVENIIYTDSSVMPDGEYVFTVHNYSQKINYKGFTAEVEFGGQILCFDHTKSMRGGEFVDVAKIRKKGNEFTLAKGTTVSESSVEVYGVKSKEFHKVTMLMNSPNYWESVANPKGNKHWFFILEECINEEPVRGMYNEFLLDSLQPHSKVFETLNSTLKVPFTEKQLSGVGFSNTQDNEVVVRVRGGLNNTYNIKFN